MLLGERIKELREQHGVLQRQLAEYFKVDKNELLTLWLADKVLDAVEDEDELKHNAIEVAQKKIG